MKILPSSKSRTDIWGTISIKYQNFHNLLNHGIAICTLLQNCRYIKHRSSKSERFICFIPGHCKTVEACSYYLNDMSARVVTNPVATVASRQTLLLVTVEQPVNLYCRKRCDNDVYIE